MVSQTVQRERVTPATEKGGSHQLRNERG
jgi:hypothetical protein